MTRQQVKSLLKEIGIVPKKSLGQNFLIQPELCKRIVKEVQKHPAPWLEIGPGLGSLTWLFEDQKSHLVLVEKDKAIYEFWKNKNFSVLHKDALKLSWQELPKKFTLFGNLPYQITHPLIIKSTNQLDQIPIMILMMQKEVSERLRSSEGGKNYSWISVFAQTFWDIKVFAEAGTQDFYPSPKVAGQVLIFKRKKSSISPTDLAHFLQACFTQRRKKLLKQISHFNLPQPNKIFEQMKLSLNTRAEELSPEKFLKLYKIVSKSIE